MATKTVVRMKTLSAGPVGNREVGKEYLVPVDEAKDLVAGGYAEFVKTAATEPEETESAETETTEETSDDDELAETATVEPEETAVAKHTRKNPLRKRNR